MSSTEPGTRLPRHPLPRVPRSIHVYSGWYEPNVLLILYQFLASFSFPDSLYTNSPLFCIQTVTVWQFCGKLVKSLPDYALERVVQYTGTVTVRIIHVTIRTDRKYLKMAYSP